MRYKGKKWFYLSLELWVRLQIQEEKIHILVQNGGFCKDRGKKSNFRKIFVGGSKFSVYLPQIFAWPPSRASTNFCA